MTPLPQLPPEFAETRDELHRLAVYVISPAQRLVNGEIILRATPGGFSTFEFDGRSVGVNGADLVIDGVHGPIGSLNDAARRAGIDPDVAQQEQFDVPPHGDLDEPLAVGAAAGRALGAWYAFATDVLEAVRSSAAPGEDATIVPRATRTGRVDAFFDDPGFSGAARTHSQLAASGDPLAAAVRFLRDARERVRRRPA